MGENRIGFGSEKDIWATPATVTISGEQQAGAASLSKKASPRLQDGRSTFSKTPARMDLRPSENKPLGGAFQVGGSKVASSPSPAKASALSEWTGPMLDPEHLGQAAETEILRSLRTELAVLPYKGFDPQKKPVILIHGFGAMPENLKDLADHLSDRGHQVFFVCYEDKKQTVTASGACLARAIGDLRSRFYPPGTPLDIVGHSMGGLVGRCALNELQQPGWLHGRRSGAGEPRGGFGPVRFRTLDTPWEGFAESMPSWQYPIVRFFMMLFGSRASADMVTHSQMYKHLYEPKLNGVEMMNTAARQPGEQDNLRALPDLRPKELRAIVRYVETGKLPRTPCARNMALSLAQDARYPALVRELAAEQGKPGRSADGGAAALVAAYERVMRRAVGDHTGILTHHDGDPLDVVDQVVSNLDGRQ